MSDRAADAETQELRLALVALVSTMAELGPRRCATTLDEARSFASHASPRLVAAAGAPPERAILIRFNAARALDSLCAACGECPRGDLRRGEPIMADDPPPTGH